MAAVLLDHKSTGVSKVELDLFSVPPTQVTVDKGFWEEIQLSNPCTNEGPYEFRVPPDPNMIQINNNYIYMVLRIVTNAGVGYAANAAGDLPNIGPINLLGKTFFEDIKVWIGGNMVFSSNNLYPYRAYFETIPNYGQDARDSHLQAALYYHDTEGQMDTADNDGFQKRRELFRDGQYVELMAPIHCDLFEQNRYLLDNMDMRVVLRRAKDQFLLMRPGEAGAALNYKIEVQSMKWVIRKVVLPRPVWEGVEGALMESPAMYPIRRAHLTTLHVGHGRRETPTTALFTGRLPRRITVGMVSGRAFRGDSRQNPFNFQHFNISCAKIIAGGQTFPEGGYRFDIHNQKYLQGYMGLFEALGIADDNKGNCISRNAYINGYTLLGFDLTADSDDGDHWQPVKEGSLAVHLEFAEPIADLQGIEVIVYAEYDGLVSVDRNRQASTDFNP